MWILELYNILIIHILLPQNSQAPQIYRSKLAMKLLAHVSELIDAAHLLHKFITI